MVHTVERLKHIWRMTGVIAIIETLTIPVGAMMAGEVFKTGTPEQGMPPETSHEQNIQNIL